MNGGTIEPVRKSHELAPHGVLQGCTRVDGRLRQALVVLSAAAMLAGCVVQEPFDLPPLDSPSHPSSPSFQYGYGGAYGYGGTYGYGSYFHPGYAYRYDPRYGYYYAPGYPYSYDGSGAEGHDDDRDRRNARSPLEQLRDAAREQEQRARGRTPTPTAQPPAVVPAPALREAEPARRPPAPAGAASRVPAEVDPKPAPRGPRYDRVPVKPK